MQIAFTLHQSMQGVMQGPTIEAADLLIYQSSNRQAVEAVCECLPKANVVPPFALIIEAVNPIDGRTLMVTSQQKEVLWILDLHSLHQDL